MPILLDAGIRLPKGTVLPPHDPYDAHSVLRAIEAWLDQHPSNLSRCRKTKKSSGQPAPTEGKTDAPYSIWTRARDVARRLDELRSHLRKKSSPSRMGRNGKRGRSKI